MSGEDDDGTDESLERLAAMGHGRGEAVDALMQCGGDWRRAAGLLAGEGAAEGDGNATGGGGRDEKRGGKKDKKKKKTQGGGSGGVGTGGTGGGRSFQEQRKAELGARKAKRDGRQVCRVCGGAHPRRECPGVVDDGRGQARWNDKTAQKRDRKGRRERERAAGSVERLLRSGLWTKDVPYYDGLADICASPFWKIEKNAGDPADDDPLGYSSLVRWIDEWARLEAELGGSPAALPMPDQVKRELKNERVKVLREKALSAAQDKSQVESAMESGNPKSELIKLIMSGTEQDLPSRRLSHEEWPGYRGCIAPFSVLDSGAMESLKHLQKIEGEGALGLKVLLAITPAQISKWVVAGSQDDEVPADKEKIPIDVAAMIQSLSDMEQAEAELKLARQQLIASKKKARAHAEAKVMRLQELLASRQENTALLESNKTLESMELSPVVGEMLDEAVSSIMTGAALKHDQNRLVVGISCGLDYRTPETLHPTAGTAVRKSQRKACEHAVKVAVKANLPIVLECHNSPPQKPFDGVEEQISANLNAKPMRSTAVSDLIKILVESAPSDTTILLRCGSLTTSEEPGLLKILEVWPKLFVGFSSSLSYSKCPKELLDAAFDVPLEKIILTSEAPNSLPPELNSSKVKQLCVPPHVACVAEQIASIKKGSDGGTETSREKVLQVSTSNLCKAFGLDEPI